MQLPTVVLYANNTIQPNNYMFTQSTMLKTPIQTLYNQEIYQERITICKNDHTAAEHSKKRRRGILISSSVASPNNQMNAMLFFTSEK